MDKLPSSWQTCTLSKVVKINSGIALPKIFKVGYTSNGNIPFFKVAQMNNHELNMINPEYTFDEEISSLHKVKVFPKGSTLIPKRGGAILTNKKRLLQVDASYDSNIMGLKADNSLLLDEYLFKFMLSINLSNFVDTSSIPQINNKHIDQIIINYPPLPEQKRIVSKLDALFEHIDKSMALLEENITHTESLMASALDEVFTITSRRVSISDLIEKTKNINPKQNPNQEFTYIDITSINNKTHIIEDPKFVKGDDAPSRARKGVEYGDILFATTRPNLRNIAVINKSYNNPIASTGFCVLRVKKGVNSDFLFNCLLSNEIQKQITPFIRGAQYPAISDKNLTSCEVPALEFKEQNAIAERIKLLRDKAIKLQEEQQDKLNNLKALKESILDKTFKGQI